MAYDFSLFYLVMNIMYEEVRLVHKLYIIGLNINIIKVKSL